MSLGINLGGAAAPRRRSAANAQVLDAALGAIGLAGLWFAVRPYKGVWHDAVIYLGRGLADLDPNSVGQDLSFRYDGQSAFSLYRIVVEALIPVLGLSGASFFLSFSALALWLAAFWALASQLASGRQKWAILLSVAAAQAGYGALGVFSYAESFATPRPFAEAGVVAALAALLAGLVGRALLFVCLAALLHPIMALAGAAVLYLHLCLKDRRWIFAGAVGALAVLAAASLGVPTLRRILQPFDRQWLTVLRLHTTYLFPLSWPERSFAPVVVGSLTLAWGAALASGAVRRLFATTLFASLAGLAVATVFGDLYPSQLVEQAQLWRMTWLLQLFSTIALCFVVPELRKRGAAGLASLSLLASGWMSFDSMQGALFCALAIPVACMDGLVSARAMRLLAWVCAAIAILSAMTNVGAHLYGLIHSWREAPPGAVDLPQRLGASVALRLPVMVAALVWANGGFNLPKTAQVAAVAAATFLAIVNWRGPGDDFARLAEADARAVELERLVAARPGEVLWIGESPLAAWTVLGRPSWTPSGGLLFSRDMALAWRDRALALVENEWIDRRVFALWLFRGAPEKSLPELSREKVERVCSRPDAPAWILGAVKSPVDIPADVEAQIWRGPAQILRREIQGERVWDAVKDVAVIDCARYGESGIRR